MSYLLRCSACGRDHLASAAYIAPPQWVCDTCLDDVEHDEGGSGCCARGFCGAERQARVGRDGV